MQALIEALRQHNSISDKKLIIQSKGNTPEARKVFRYAYEPLRTYGVKFDYVQSNIGTIDEAGYAILNNLSSRTLSGNKAREVVESYAKEHGSLIKLICNKDLACGVSITILNLVYGSNFIAKFAIQLSKEAELDKLTFPLWAQLKYNGARVLAIIEDGTVTLKSRGGHTFYYEKLVTQILALNITENCVLDGELTFGDSKNEDHTRVSGLINSSIKTDVPISNSFNLQFNVFDYLPLDEFNSQVCKTSYTQRFIIVTNLIAGHSDGMIRVALNYVVKNIEELQELYSDLLKDGYEGLILKGPNHTYTYKKNKVWLKMKATETADLLCTGTTDGKDKYDGMIGALICEGIVENKFVTVNVGSGLDDNDRDKDPNVFVGKVIEVKYNKVIRDKNTGKYSLFLPRYVVIRNDKS